MKKFLKLGLCFLSLVPISLSVYACSTNTKTTVENNMYYDVNDKKTVKVIDSGKEFGLNFWEDLIIYDTTIKNNNEVLKSNIKIDLRIFKYLEKIYSASVGTFFITAIDEWAKQFSTGGIDDFKGQIDYYFPDSFQGFYGDSEVGTEFYLPFQKNVDFGNATIKETLAFNMNNDNTECIFPESVEKIYYQWYSSNVYISHYFSNDNFLLTLRKIVFPSNFTAENIEYKDNRSIFPFKAGYFFKNAIKNDKVPTKVIGYNTYYSYYFEIEEDEHYTQEVEIGYFTEKEQELINNRLKAEKPMEIKISKTFENDDHALKYVFGWELLDEEFELLKTYITYI
ncbi:MAG: hypothetical protein K2J02_00600 [Malacoplasma sp.]|nr:hypothetical protein [Malacoplasma sp.]